MKPLQLQRLVKRIKPRDGLAVNASIWEQAHTFHRDHHRAHLLLGHGGGIVFGLGVYPEAEPADTGQQRLWIQPGVAVDPAEGWVIVLEEQHSYVVDTTDSGLIYLVLTGADEKELQSTNTSRRLPILVRHGNSIESTIAIPERGIELARIRLSGSGHKLQSAQIPDMPQMDEIDLRFRPLVGARPQPKVVAGIIYFGANDEQNPAKYGRKAGLLARTLSHHTRFQVWFDDDISLEANLQPYTFLYLIERGTQQLSQDQIEGLVNFVREREAPGTLFIESYLSVSPLLETLQEQGLALTSELPNELMSAPYLFSAPPPGTNPEGVVQSAPGIIFSTRHYGALWQRSDPDQSRESIRTAEEWGANLVSYAVKRRGDLT